MIVTKTINQLIPSAEGSFTFSINANEFDNDVSEEARTYYFLIETEELESDGGNNSKFVNLYPDYDVALISGTGGSVSGGGTYIKGDKATLIVPSHLQDIFLMDGMRTARDCMVFLTNTKLL